MVEPKGRDKATATATATLAGLSVEQVLEFAPDAIIGADGDGRIVLANHQTELLFGYSRDELLGEQVEALIPQRFRPGHPEHRTGYFADPRTRPMDELALHGVRKDGTEFPAEISLSSIDVDAGRLAVAAVRDVTERRSAEQARARLAAIVDASDDAIVGFATSGIITSWNAGAERLFELSADEAIGHPVTAVTQADGPLRVADLLARAVDIEAVEHHEVQYQRSDGTTVDVHLTLSPIRGADGAVTGVATIARDISARKRAELMFQHLLRFAPDAIVGVDQGGTIVLANEQAELLFGYTRDELVGSSLDRLVPARSRGVHPAHRQEYFDDPVTRPMGAGLELAGVRKDGSEFPAEISLSSIKTHDGVVATVAVRDISERAESERERKMAEELNQARRLESVGQLAGGIAHDFNNLLGVIINYATFVADELPETGQAHDDVEEIRHAARRAADLTRQLLIFSRREIVKREVLDLNGLVAGLENLLRRALGERVELELRFGENLWPIEADPGQLEQILVNLAVNARDAMPDGGRLLVETANAMVDEPLAGGRGDLASGRYVRLTVTDVGVGMDEEVRRRALEPFFTTKPKGEGTGLGLATVYGIVTQAGGRLDLDSELGHGTSVKVHLPATDRSLVPAGAAVPDAPKGRGETLLVVEDEPEVRQLTERILTSAGYLVMTASGGAEALSVTSAENVDLLLTDLVMPGMLGSELVERLRADRPELKVVIMSGYSHAVLSGSEIADSPWSAFIEKPFTADGLLRAVRELLDVGEAT
jgi:PAS domain S-box-containing protein